MRVCGAPSYLGRRGTPRTIAALARHERIGFVVNGRPLPWRLEENGNTREIAPGRRLVTDDAETLLDLAVAGAGLGL
jgi:DNA-binding transcriptional LysR family regulator